MSFILSWSFTFSVFFLAAQLFLSGRVLMRRAPLSNAHAWLLVIWLLPVIGMGAYLLIGENRLGVLRLRKYASWERTLGEYANEMWLAREHTWDGDFERFRPLARLGASLCDAPAVEGNELSLHADAERTLDAMIADIDAAQSHCHLLSYIFHPAGKPLELAEALARAAARGVECRVALDGAGSRRFFKDGVGDRLRASGVEVIQLLEVNLFRLLFRRLDLRNHRKVLVIDGRIAYTGSHNITDDLFRPKGPNGPGPWIDASVRVEGYAARALALMFLADWNTEAANPIEDPEKYLPSLGEHDEDEITSAVQILPTGPNSRHGAVQAMLVSAMYAARRELVVATPYFVPDMTVNTALMTAAARGVDVTLILPARNDAPIVDFAGRASYQPLLDAGVKIMRYRPGLLHAKAITVDGRVALIGSANIDQRSFRLNFEITMAVYDTAFAGTLRSLQQHYIHDSDVIDPEEWRSRPLWRKLGNNAASLFSPIL